MKGWIKIHREIQDHWLWNERREYSRAEAWIDILLTVNHAEGKVMIKNHLYTVKRGQSVNSLETWAKRWNWTRGRVKRFLELLKGVSDPETKSKIIGEEFIRVFEKEANDFFADRIKWKTDTKTVIISRIKLVTVNKLLRSSRSLSLNPRPFIPLIDSSIVKIRLYFPIPTGL